MTSSFPSGQRDGGLVGDALARNQLARAGADSEAIVDRVAERLGRDGQATDHVGTAFACYLDLGLGGAAHDLGPLCAAARYRADAGETIDSELQMVALICEAIAAELTAAASAQEASAMTISQLTALSFETHTVLSQVLIETFVAHRGQEQLVDDEARADIARSFLAGDYSRSARWLEHAKSLGADPNGAYLVACIEPRGDDPLDTERLLARVGRALHELETYSACIDVDGIVTAVVSLTGVTPEAVRTTLDRANLGGPFEAGISRAIKPASALPTALDQARTALLDGPAEPMIRPFDRLPIVDVCCLTAARSGSTPLPYWIGELEATLPRGEAPLLHTLEVWLTNDLSLADTASELVVHPNTVTYRLRQIESITGLDSRRFDDVVQLALAVRLRGFAAFEA